MGLSYLAFSPAPFVIMGVVLLLLVVSLLLFRRTQQGTTTAAPEKNKVQEAIAAESIEQVVTDGTISRDELIAVITAAIAAYGLTQGRFVVRSVRKTSAWGQLSRTEQMQNRL